MNLPYVIDGDQIIAQTNACFAHLGRVLGLYGSNYAETVKVEQCLCQVRISMHRLHRLCSRR